MLRNVSLPVIFLAVVVVFGIMATIVVLLGLPDLVTSVLMIAFVVPATYWLRRNL